MSVSAPVDLGNVLAAFQDSWSPRAVAVLNDYDIRVVKTKGEFARHSHPDTDEFFLVVRGNLTIRNENDVPFRTMDAALASGKLRAYCLGVTLDALTLSGIY